MSVAAQRGDMTTAPDGLVRRIEPVARSYFGGDASPAHDWSHVERVRTNAETLAAASPAADRTVVRLAALLHDIGRGKERAGEIDDHAEWGAEESETRLIEHGASVETAEAVAHCVRTHRYSTGPDPRTIEAELVSDADDLDALGAVGLARCFAHGGVVGSPIHDPSGAPEAGDATAGGTQLDHVRGKLFDIPGRLHTEAGRELADGRASYVRQFVRQFEAEVAGSR